MPDKDAPILIITALREELAAICAKLKPMAMETVDGIPCYTGKMGKRSLVIVRCGMGADRARTAAGMMIHSWNPSGLIVAGFAGALTAEVHPGDIVVANRLFDCNEGVDLIPTLLFPHLTAPNLCVHVGGMASSSHVVSTTKDRIELAKRTNNSIMVEMETAGAAQEAERLGVPWAALRAISDGIDDEMPFDFAGMTDQFGEVNRLRVIGALIGKPWKLPALLQLAKRSRQAADSLSSAVYAACAIT